MRKWGLGAGTALVAGNMIGSGIFLLPAGLAVYGRWGLIGWAMASVGAILLAAVFRQLATVQPHAPGGPYSYVRRAFGDLPGFAVAWGLLGFHLVHECGHCSGGGGLLGGVLSRLIRKCRPRSGLRVVGLILVFTAINGAGVRQVLAVQTVTTVLKVLPLMAVGLLGLPFIEMSNLWADGSYEGSAFGAVTAATTLTLFAFLGVESAAISSGRLRNPDRNVGRASMLGTMLTVVVYLLGSVAIMGAIPPVLLMDSSAPFAEAAGAFWGEAARPIMAGAAVMATLGALNGWLFIQGEFPMAAADDGLFPAVFARRNRAGIPWLGIVLSSVLACAVLLLKFSDSLVETFTFMMTLSTLSALVPYLLSGLALRRLLRGREEGAWGRSLGMVTVAFCAWVIFGCGSEVLLYGGLLFGFGLALYAARTSLRSRP